MLRTTNLSLPSSILCILCALTACTNSPSPSSGSSTPPPVVTDTLGKQFIASCSSSLCTLTAQDPSLKPLSCDSVSAAYGTDAFVLLWSRVLTIHVMNVSSSGGAPELTAGEPGHPVACTTADDCATWDTTVGSTQFQFTCLNGICQDPAQALTANDVITLCQADIAWPFACPYVASLPFANRLAEIAVSCIPNAKCSVPADCWQATATADAGASAVDGSSAAVLDGGAQASVDAM